MAKGKNVLTTGEVARICNVAARTVSKWFDSGQLKGYRIPGSNDRRIPVSELIRFMKLHSMPAAALPVGRLRVLIADSDSDAALTLADTLRAKTDYEVRTVGSNFEAGVIAQKFAPHVLLVSLASQRIAATDICKNIRANEDLQTTRIIAIASRLNDSDPATLMQKGFDGCISNPADAAEVIKKIEEATAIVY